MFKKNSLKFKNWQNVKTAGAIVLSILIVIILHSYVFQPYKVSGCSMSPTLVDDDRLLVLKLHRSLAKLRTSSFVPNRGDIVVFKSTTNNDEHLIKRVIGLPNERILIEAGRTIIYNQDYPDGFQPQFVSDGQIIQPHATDQIDATLGPNQLFVMGDNRLPGASLDSRSSLGPVTLDNVIGTLWTKLSQSKDTCNNF